MSIIDARRLQKEYAQGFNKFKPDKRLKWLPQLGTMQLELELGDRTVEATVPPLEAAFIELFSQKRRCSSICDGVIRLTFRIPAVWSMVELIEAVGNIDRSAALKALITWVDLGVLKEDTEDTFRLLEVAEEPSAEPRERRTSMFTLCDVVIKTLILGLVPVVPEVPPVASAQQQQAEKMKVYWKVRDIIPIKRHDKYIAITVYRRHAYESRSTSGRQDTIYAQNRPRVRSDNRAAWCVSGDS